MCELCKAKEEIKRLKQVISEFKQFTFGIREATSCIDMVGSSPLQNLKIIRMQSEQASKLLKKY